MEGFGLLIGHLLGDYILQNDFVATWKSGGLPLPETEVSWAVGEYRLSREDARKVMENQCSRRADITCTVHCFFYTLAVWACSYWWMPWWGLSVCFLIHWPIDRFRLAKWWMVNVSGQKLFAEGPLAPWSIVVVDNTFHLLTLFLIGMLVRVT
jgi:hypothetical protein